MVMSRGRCSPSAGELSYFSNWGDTHDLAVDQLHGQAFPSSSIAIPYRIAGTSGTLGDHSRRRNGLPFYRQSGGRWD